MLSSLLAGSRRCAKYERPLREIIRPENWGLGNCATGGRQKKALERVAGNENGDYFGEGCSSLKHLSFRKGAQVGYCFAEAFLRTAGTVCRVQSSFFARIALTFG